MTEPVASESAAPVAASSPSTIMEILEAHAAEQESASPPAAASAAPAKPTPAGFVDPLDESNFAPEKLGTAEGIRAARDLLQAQLKEAYDIRRKAHNARAEAERREGKFKATKASILQEKQAVTAQMNLLQQELGEIQSGDPARFTSAIARLANKSDDPIGFWREVATHIATGTKPTASPEQLKAQIAAELREELRKERDAEQRQHQERDTEQRLLEARQHQIAAAATYTDLPNVASLAQEKPELIDARLVDIRTEHFRRTGQQLDLRAACDIVEGEIRSHFELLQRVNSPATGVNGERGVAAPAAGLARLPERNANPDPAPRAPVQNRSVTAVPASLTAAPAAANRPRTAAEKKAAITAGLEQLGVFANFGIRE